MTFIEENLKPNQMIGLIILVNLIPIAGVLFFGYSIGNILLLYWLESAVIGFYTILKMIMAKGMSNEPLASVGLKIFLIPFFTVHYGGFMAAHLFFLIFLMGVSIDTSAFASIAFVIFNLAAMFVSHGVSFFFDYIQSGTFKKAEAPSIMFTPYPRIFVMYITIIFGAIVVAVFNAPLFLLILLIILKTIVDIMIYKHRDFFSGITQFNKNQKKKAEETKTKESKTAEETKSVL